MIRYEGTNLEGFQSEIHLPVRSDQVRVLCLHGTAFGFGTYHRVLMEYLRQDDEVDVVAVELKPELWQSIIGKSIRFLHHGWDFHALRHLLLWRWRINRWFRRTLDLARFDVVHFMTEGNAWSLVDIPKSLPIIKAVNIDATARQFITEYHRSPTAYRVMLAAQEAMYQSADLIVARNHWALRSLLDDYGISEQKTILARNSIKCPPVSRADFPPTPEGDLVRLVFVGNDFLRKGGAELVHIHQERFQNRAELHIFSRRAVPDHSLKNVIWHGHTPRDQLMTEHLPRMDVFIMPTFEDMHPWALVEAASLGLPIISTRMAGIPDIVLHDKTGLLCPAGDWDAVAAAMETLVGNSELRLQMGRAAREHIRVGFDPDLQFGGLVERFKQLARGDYPRNFGKSTNSGVRQEMI